METRLAAAIDAIYDALTAADLDANIWDGPVTSGKSGDTIFLGYDADPEGDAQAGTSTQEWAGIGRRSRDEEIDVTCAAVVLIGGNDKRWKPARDRAIALIESVGVVLRGNPSLGLSTPIVFELQPGEYFQENGPTGYQARFVFTVHVKTRI
jgi:hypothetical protein